MNVDVIVATYKRYDLLKDALQSVSRQSYPHWTCWIAEDGETEETYDVVKPFLQDERFVYLPGRHAGFPAVPRNRAVSQGNGKFVAVLDDDDLWLPQKLENQIHFIKKHPDCVVLGCNAYYWNGIIPFNKAPLYFRKEKTGKIDYATYLKQNFIIHSSSLVKRNALEKAGLYNEKLNPPIGEDYELFLRVGALGEIWSLPEPYVVYRQTPSTFYSSLNRVDKYALSANILHSALQGVEGVPSPLSYPENAPLAAACRSERDFYLAGPRFLGRLRHDIQSKIKDIFN